MKHAMLTFGLVAALATGLNAQTPGTATVPGGVHQNQKEQLSPAERAKKGAEIAEQKLALTNDQKTKWEAAALQRAIANDPIREKMKGCTTPQERKDYHSQMKVNGKKYTTTVVALLTTDQKTKYEQMKKDRKAKKHKMHRGTERMPDPKNNDQK